MYPSPKAICDCIFYKLIKRPEKQQQTLDIFYLILMILIGIISNTFII
jgi:hypothetical protein